MAGSPLNIYGNYQQALDRYWQLADLYNAAGNQYNQDVQTWNDWVNAGAQGTPPMERPAESFNMARPEAPMAPGALEVSSIGGNIDPTQLYQTLYGKATPDIMSNEAWGLQNISSPFLSSETGTAYDTGGVNRMNNPLSYVGPDVLTTGQGGYDINSIISGQMTGNPYY